jgi:4-alpha-glucanotransferase
MSDNDVRDLAQRAGVELNWTDYADKPRDVPLDAVRDILTALGIGCRTKADIAQSRRTLEPASAPVSVTAVAGQPIDLPSSHFASDNRRARVTMEDGNELDVDISADANRLRLPAVHTVGYHRLEIANKSVVLAVAPPRCFSIEDLAAGKQLAGLAAQIYGLRHAHDCGIGDMAGVTALAGSAARMGIDALALSPTHALFVADPGHYSPYSPSSRLFYNPLLADPTAIFGEMRIARARVAAALGIGTREREAAPLIDWQGSSRDKLAVMRCLFEDFAGSDLAGDASGILAADFRSFRTNGGLPLEQHALFDTLHEARLQADPTAWSWRSWPAEWRNPKTEAVRRFAKNNQHEVLFHIFLQWIANRSIALTQEAAKNAGMQIGLLGDLAVGMSSDGSYTWTNQSDVLLGVEIGAPPDLFNRAGQNWGLTTFSPTALVQNGFEPFIKTLRTCMRHVGGVRIDHAMGLMHLWIVPHGAKASEGAYLTYPLKDLLRLIALESHRHKAIVIGEDLGTVPEGFRNRLQETAIYGLRVLWFERDAKTFLMPQNWTTEAVAMTSTHDLPTVAGWWSGSDLETRTKHSTLAKNEKADRVTDRVALWNAFRDAQAADGEPPSNAAVQPVADAAVTFIAETPSRLALLPLEDALASVDQPNLPGTIDEHPNWRRRYPGDAATLLADTSVANRVKCLASREVK